MIAITKAVLADARIIIMDEPTTALTRKEVTALFKLIDELKSRGISILFVSHKLNEITEIADRTIIFRNGKKVIDQDATELDVQSMEYHMTGRKLDTGAIQIEEIEATAPLLRVQNLNLSHGFFDISFDLFPREVLGITGLLGSGRTELALSLFGEMPANSGKIFVNGKEVRIRNIKDAMQQGIAYVPDDRIREGLFLDQSISNNIVVSLVSRLAKSTGLLRRTAVRDESSEWIKKMEIKTPSGDLPVKSLSGGNQQRVVLAKWLACNPKILILNGPTVGVDVGSKAELHELIRSLAKEGMGILLISDDIPELQQTCHRILLMRSGRIIQEFKRKDINESALNSGLVGPSLATRTGKG